VGCNVLQNVAVCFNVLQCCHTITPRKLQMDTAVADQALLNVQKCIHIHIYMYTHIYVYIYIHIDILHICIHTPRSADRYCSG